MDPPGQSPLTVRLYADQPAYDRAVGPESARSEPNGRFSAQTNELITWYRPSPDAMAQTLAGETSRALLRQRYPSAPSWLREGLSRYFELLRVLDDATAVFPDPHLDQALRALRGTDQLLPTARLLALSGPEWQDENQTDERAAVQSWSLVYFLLSAKDGAPLLAEILKRSATTTGEDTAVSASVIDAGYPGGVEMLDREWRDWITTHKAAHYY